MQRSYSEGTTTHNKRKKRCKKNSACHNCKLHHVACDGTRPCRNCLDRNKPCVDHDPHNPRALPELSLSGTPMNIVKQEIANRKRKIAQQEKIIRELEQQRDQLTEQLTQTQKQQLLDHSERLLFTNQQHTVIRNEFTIDLWGENYDIRNPMFLFNPTTRHMIGCNEAFCRLTGYSKQELKEDFVVFNIVPERNRSTWKFITEWMLISPVKFMKGSNYIQLKDREVVLSGSVHFQRSCVMLVLEPIEYFSDEQVVNDVVLPATVNVPYSSEQQSTSFETPVSSFQRLLNLLRNMSPLSVYRDQHDSQLASIVQLQNEIQSAYADTTTSIPTNLYHTSHSTTTTDIDIPITTSTIIPTHRNSNNNHYSGYDQITTTFRSAIKLPPVQLSQDEIEIVSQHLNSTTRSLETTTAATTTTTTTTKNSNNHTTTTPTANNNNNKNNSNNISNSHYLN